ncbi:MULTISPECIES: extracellular solute-binding protein [unclassified Roseitalea]|uniref:extracellular solute-binding protein n=1 Tax=unclassified Roseitalea TaxID=2639107 RepID=UPI00273E5B26|nr:MULTISPECIES: extracellular solute-binding protein [unclassified Roseitalea]
MIIDRRRFLTVAAGGYVASAAFPRLCLAANPTGVPRHGLSAFGDLKYAAGFAAFDYANPDAPVGGTFNFQPGYWYFNQNTQTFNTLNSFVRRGDAPPRMEMCYDSLVASAHDEPDAVYCHVAETVTISQDGNRFTFRLRDIARFHDGTPITAADVKFSYDTLKAEGHPQLSLPLDPLAEVIAEDARTVTLVFDGTQSAQAILSVAGYPILSAAYYADRTFDESTLDAPLGSGPYRVGDFSAGRYIEYERVPDYWARGIGTGRGTGHFQTIRIEFYAERQAGFEAFKKGEIHWRREFTSKTWATEYNFPAVEEGQVVQRLFDDLKRPGMQAWALNQRRERFKDRRVRDAIGLCFDFEWTNQNLFYGLYARSQSIFGGSQYEAAGTPDEDETALIQALGADHQLPDGIMDDAYIQSAADGSGRDRARLREATRLLEEAGWTAGGDGLLRNAAGETLDVELLIRASVFERIYGPFVEVMRMVGINAGLRLVDPAQYQARTAEFDFDMAGFALTWGATPTEPSLEGVLGSKSAELPGSRNWPGTADPLVDALIARVGDAENRDQHETAMRVLDRVLRLRRDWIPNWTAPNQFIAYWDMFGFGEMPDYFWPVEALWWFDEDRARAIGRA